MAEIFRPNFRDPPTGTRRRDLPDRKSPLVTDDEYGEKELCLHEYVALLTKSRVVVCRQKDCKRQLDPFDVLLRLTRAWENATYLDAEIKKRHEVIAELKRIEQNTKSRIKRAGGIVPPQYEIESAARDRVRKEEQGA